MEATGAGTGGGTVNNVMVNVAAPPPPVIINSPSYHIHLHQDRQDRQTTQNLQDRLDTQDQLDYEDNDQDDQDQDLREVEALEALLDNKDQDMDIDSPTRHRNHRTSRPNSPPLPFNSTIAHRALELPPRGGDGVANLIPINAPDFVAEIPGNFRSEGPTVDPDREARERREASRIW